MSRSFSDLTFAWKSGWSTRTSRHAKLDDARFSDEDILTIIRAGESGLKVEALCSASSIPIETYYVWKAKYTGLAPLELRKRRDQERRKARTLKASATAASSLVLVAGVLYGFTRSPLTSAAASPAMKTAAPRANPPSPAAREAEPTPPTAPAKSPTGAATDMVPIPLTPVATAAEPRPSGKSRATASARSDRPASTRLSVNASEILTADPSGPSVQVAAVPNLADAGATLERLAALGYPAHMATKVVNQVEMYRVRVGPLKSRAVAEEVARKLERDGFPSPWITR